MHEGCQQGLEYTITTALLRREDHTDEDATPDTDALPPTPPPPTDRPLTDEEKRMLRRLLGGAIPTYAKLYEHLQVTTPRCPCCTTGAEETIEHILWHCPTWQPQRQQIHDTHGHDVHLHLPPSVLRALVLPEHHDWHAAARQETPYDRHHPPPPWHLRIPPHSE